MDRTATSVTRRKAKVLTLVPRRRALRTRANTDAPYPSNVDPVLLECFRSDREIARLRTQIAYLLTGLNLVCSTLRATQRRYA